jgi:hypothetical protein
LLVARLLLATCCGLALTAAAAACARQGNTPAGTPTAVTSVHLEASAVPAPAMSLPLVPVAPGVATPGCAEPAPGSRTAPGIATRPATPSRSRGAGPDDAQPKPAPHGAGPNDAGPKPAPHGAGPNDAGQPKPGPRGAGTNEAAQPKPAPRGTDPNDFDDPDGVLERRRALEALQSPVPRRGEVPAAAVPAAEACVRLLQAELTLLGVSAGGPADTAVEAALRRAGLRNPVVKPGPAFAGSTGSACVVGSFAGTRPSLVIAPLDPAGACIP